MRTPYYKTPQRIFAKLYLTNANAHKQSDIANLRATNQRQFEILVEFMTENDALAKNRITSTEYKAKINMLWMDLKNKLNGEGPPTKSVDGWKKVWKDYKYHIKGKLKSNKNTVTGTGGGPNKTFKFSSLEEQVIQLLDLNEEVGGFGAPTFGIQNTNYSEVSTSPNETFYLIIEDCMEVNENERVENAHIEVELTNSPLTQRTPTIAQTCLPRKKKRSNIQLIEKQVNAQKDFHKISCEFYQESLKVQKDTLRCFKDIRRIKEKKLNILIQKHQDESRDRLERRKLLQKKLEIKAQMLQIEQEKKNLEY